MTRHARPLMRKYGKLHVLKERLDRGRRIATVRCRCGVEKEVYADALVAGRTRSCGAATCRQYGLKKAERVVGYQPTGPRTISIERLHKYWLLHRDEKWTIYRIAEEFSENRNTLYSAFRAVRRAGGWAHYTRKPLS